MSEEELLTVYVNQECPFCDEQVHGEATETITKSGAKKLAFKCPNCEESIPVRITA